MDGGPAAPAAGFRLWRVSLSGPRAERRLGRPRQDHDPSRPAAAPCAGMGPLLGDSEGFISSRSQPASGNLGGSEAAYIRTLKIADCSSPGNPTRRPEASIPGSLNSESHAARLENNLQNPATTVVEECCSWHGDGDGFAECINHKTNPGCTDLKRYRYVRHVCEHRASPVHLR